MARPKSRPSRAARVDERVSEHLELLASMASDFASTRDVEATLKRALERITRSVEAEGGALFLLDGGGKLLRCHASVGATEIAGLTLGSDQGIVGRCVQANAGTIVRDVSQDPHFHKGFDQKTGYTTRSILCAPMSVKDERIGAIELINKRGGDGLFDPDDLRLLTALSASAALAVLNARMAEALVEQERVKRELELAAEIQRSLLPPPRDARFPVHGINVPARTVSGDFFDYFLLGDGRIGFALGDVSGKGINAALLMAKTASVFRCLGKTVHEPGRLLALINEEVCETATRGMFVTMVVGVYDPRTGEVRLANAGHEPPLVRDRRGGFSALPAEMPPLGIVPGLGLYGGVPETTLSLDGGGLYLFTDGVTEGYVEDGRELRVEGLQALIRDNASLGLADQLAAVAGRIHRADAPLRDDLTMLAVDDGPAAAARAASEQAASAREIEGDEHVLSLEVPARPDRLKVLRAAVEAASCASGCRDEVARDVVLAVDEACQNIIRHAYRGAPGGRIALEMRRHGGEIVILLKDFAETVDVARVKPRDLDDVRPGGLGTHFIQTVMDQVRFLPPPPEGGNILELVKRIG